MTGHPYKIIDSGGEKIRHAVVSQLAETTMTAIVRRVTPAALLPFGGAAATLEAELTREAPLDRDGHAPDHIARAVVGVDRSADTLPIYRVFEILTNQISMMQAQIDQLTQRAKVK